MHDLGTSVALTAQWWRRFSSSARNRLVFWLACNSESPYPVWSLLAELEMFGNAAAASDVGDAGGEPATSPRIDR